MISFSFNQIWLYSYLIVLFNIKNKNKKMITAVIVGTIIFIALWIAAAAAINNYVQKDLTDQKLKEDYRS